MTGCELAAVIEDAARRDGVGLGAYLLPITRRPRQFLYSLRHAARPRAETIERVNELIAGRVQAPTIQLEYTGGNPGSINSITAAANLEVALRLKARTAERMEISRRAAADRRAGETIADACERIRGTLGGEARA